MQDAVGPRLELGDDEGVPTRLGSQAVGVGLRPHRRGAHDGGAGGDGGTRHDGIARPWAHGIRLAGENRLVHLQPVSGQDDGVGRHLLAAAQTQDVIEHHLVNGDVLLLPGPDDVGHWGVQDGEAVQRPLGAHLGQRAGGGVEDEHEAEQGVGRRTEDKHQDEGDSEDGVEDRQDVGPQDLRRRA